MIHWFHGMVTVEMFVLHLAAESVFEQKSAGCYILVTPEIMLCFLLAKFNFQTPKSR